MSDEKYITIQGLMNKQHQDQKDLIKDLDKVEELDNAKDSEQSINNEITGIKSDIVRKKKVFIDEIKSGLGNQIKKDPNKVIILNKSRWERFKITLKNLFTKF